MRSDTGRRHRPVALTAPKLYAALEHEGWKRQEWTAGDGYSMRATWWDRGSECLVVVEDFKDGYACVFTPVVSLRRARSLIRSRLQQGELNLQQQEVL